MTVPFACVGIAFLLVYAPKVAVFFAQVRAPGGYDNRHPRDQQAGLTGWGRRAVAAHQNGFEGFAPFAAAVFVAHLGGGDARLAAGLSIAFVVARTLYPILYMANLDKLRSTVWSIGFVATLALFLVPWAS